MASFEPGPTRILYALRRAHLAVEAQKERRLRALDLRPAHYAVLINVWAHPGVTGAELARHLGVTPQNVAGLVARLGARDLLTRAPHGAHAHVLEIRLTDTGRALLALADAEVAALEADVTAALGHSADALRDGLEAIPAHWWSQAVDGDQ